MPLGPHSTNECFQAPRRQPRWPRQQRNCRSGRQKICRPFARVCVHVLGPTGNKIQSKTLPPGSTTFHSWQGLSSSSSHFAGVSLQPEQSCPTAPGLKANKKLSVSSELLSTPPPPQASCGCVSSTPNASSWVGPMFSLLLLDAHMSDALKSAEG